MASSPADDSSGFCLWCLPVVDLLESSCTTQCQHYHTLETPLPLEALGLNAFNHPWMFQVSYVFHPSALVPIVLSKFLEEHVKVQIRLLILVASCWMEVPWFPTLLSMFTDVSWFYPLIKDLIMDVFDRPHIQGPNISASNPLSAQRCVLHRQGISSSVCQAVVWANQASMMKI